MSPLHWIDSQLALLQNSHLRRQLVDRSGAQKPTIMLDGHELVNFASNDYLGLANDDRVIKAATIGLQQFGFGAAASPLITGHSEAHRELEQALARFEQTEAALLFPTGFAANVGTITALVGSGDTVFSDAKNHASIIDGCRLSGANIVVYTHKDTEDLRQKLAASDNSGKRLIVTDGLFSMDGDVAPLAQLAQLAQSYGAMLMVDEAHATGVLGPHGRGSCEALGVEQQVHIRVGTLSKAPWRPGWLRGWQPTFDRLANEPQSPLYLLHGSASGGRCRRLSCTRDRRARA